MLGAIGVSLGDVNPIMAMLGPPSLRIKPCLFLFAVARLSEDHPVMQSERAVVPEFDLGRHDAIPRPVLGARNLADGIFRCIFGDGLLERKAAFQRSRLF